ncbi:hypothetical protein F5879DRAFT_995242 [Lentinula edodes]|nr:hypothetical protein F5879DRAFT_995242 [Lentinula edodes]
MDTQESSLSPITSEQQLPNVAEVVGSPVLFSHQLASQFELGDMGRAELSEVAKCIGGQLPPAMVMAHLYSLAAQFKTHENQQALKREVANLTLKVDTISESIETTPTLTKSQKDDILATCKLVVYNPVRIDYDNDSIVQDGKLKEQGSTNSFKSFFVQESTSMKRVVKDHVRIQASYAKSALRNASMRVGVTQATSTIAGSMGSSTKISVQETSRVILLRYFVRQERPDLFDTSKTKTKAKTRKPSKRARVNGDNFAINWQATNPSETTAAPILTTAAGTADTVHEGQSVDEIDEQESKATAWASGFTEWINSKINGTPGKDDALGASFINSKWHSFYQELIKEELLLFPQDLIPNIPRQRAPSVPIVTRPAAAVASSNEMTFASTASQNQMSNFFATICNQASVPRSDPSEHSSSSLLPRSNAPLQNQYTGSSSPVHSGYSSTLPRSSMRSSTPIRMESHSDTPIQETRPPPPFLDMLLNSARPNMLVGLGGSRSNNMVPIPQGRGHLQNSESPRASEGSHSNGQMYDPSSPYNDEHLSDGHWS